MGVFRIIWEGLWVAIGIGTVLAAFSGEIEFYYGIVGAALIVLCGRTVIHEIRDLGGRGEVVDAADERDQIRARIEDPAEMNGRD